MGVTGPPISTSLAVIQNYMATGKYVVHDVAEALHPSRWMATAFCLAVFLGISVTYAKQGVKGVTVLLLYISSLIFCQLAVKAVLHDFPYVPFICAFHFTFQAFMIAFWHVHLRIQATYSGKEDPKSSLSFVVPSKQWYISKVLPVALVIYVSILANNLSMIYIGAGLNALIGVCTPVVTAVMAAGLGLRIAVLGWVGVMIALVGDGVVTYGGFSSFIQEGGSSHAAIVGLSLSFLALICRALKNILLCHNMSKSYSRLSSSAEPAIKPLQMWVLQVPPLCLMSVVSCLIWDGVEPFRALATINSRTFVILLVSAVSSIGAAIGGLLVIKMVGAPAAHLAGKFNSILIAALASAFFGEALTGWEIGGTMLIMCGAYIFERAKMQEGAGKEAGVAASTSLRESITNVGNSFRYNAVKGKTNEKAHENPFKVGEHP